MNRFMIELHLVVHEITMYLADLELYGDITHYNERYPVFVWIETPWDKDIIEGINGIKTVWEPNVLRSPNTESVLREITYRRGLA